MSTVLRANVRINWSAECVLVSTSTSTARKAVDSCVEAVWEHFGISNTVLTHDSCKPQSRTNQNSSLSAPLTNFPGLPKGGPTTNFAILLFLIFNFDLWGENNPRSVSTKWDTLSFIFGYFQKISKNYIFVSENKCLGTFSLNLSGFANFCNSFMNRFWFHDLRKGPLN